VKTGLRLLQKGVAVDDLEREKKNGLSYWYLKDVPLRRKLAGDRYRTPGFGLAAQLFASGARVALDKLGPEQGEAILKEAIEAFGRERGRRIAGIVQGLGKPLSLKNWLIYSDVDSHYFSVRPRIEKGELVARVRRCEFHRAAEAWGLGEYVQYYCKYADHAILEGYNPDVRLTLEPRGTTGKDYCLFRYGVGGK